MWIDREGREATATEFAAELEAAIRAEGVTDNIVLGVADRAIENWILADGETVRPLCKDDVPYPRQPDGFKGKGKMKKLIPDYHETTIGVDLLTQCHASRMMMTSLSFKNFWDQLSENDCLWLAR